MLTLREKQSAFAVLVARLILHVQASGMAVTLGEAWRSPEEAARLATSGAGIAKSLHTQRLAIDLQLFREGVYQRDSAAYLAFGLWWEEQSTPPDIVCCWGGRFRAPDGNHFSVAHLGRK